MTHDRNREGSHAGNAQRDNGNKDHFESYKDILPGWDRADRPKISRQCSFNAVQGCGCSFWAGNRRPESLQETAAVSTVAHMIGCLLVQGGPETLEQRVQEVFTSHFALRAIRLRRH